MLGFCVFKNVKIFCMKRIPKNGSEPKAESVHYRRSSAYDQEKMYICCGLKIFFFKFSQSLKRKGKRNEI